MIFFLVPLMFMQISFLVARWLPALYLALWPAIIQSLGRDALLIHAILFIIFIITCDITRETMRRIIGLDLISLPTGIMAVLFFLSYADSFPISNIILPTFSGLLTITEPLFILLETIIIMEMISKFNKWISESANQRDEDSHDLSSWEPPLTRKAIMTRFLVIFITIGCYLSAYLIVQKSKSLLQNDLGLSEQEVPIQFNYAIAALITLQLIAFSATIYKESGILSETAMVAAAAAVPIFIASWSFYHLRTEADASSSWTSYLKPFSLFGDSSSASDTSHHLAKAAGVAPYADDFGPGLRENLRAFERSLDSSSSTSSTGSLPWLLLLVTRQSLRLTISTLGLSWERLEKYYFGAEFWYIFVARVGCLIWWLSRRSRRSVQQQLDAGDQLQDQQTSRKHGNGVAASDATVSSSTSSGAPSRLRSWFPCSQTTLVKVLLVAAYTQMIIQQMENKQNLSSGNQMTLGSGDHQTNVGFCYSSSDDDSCLTSPAAASSSPQLNVFGAATDWLSCVWSSAQACSSSSSATNYLGGGQQPTRAQRLLDQLSGLLVWLLALGRDLLQRLMGLQTLLSSAYFVWLVRWRSPIVQRLMQSMLVQGYYVGSVMLSRDEAPAETLADYL